MTNKLVMVILICIFPQFIYAQSDTYIINKAQFSSDKYDEFSPVYFNNGIVYCSNRNAGLSSYSSGQDKGLFKIYFADTTGRGQPSRLFSKNLNFLSNDGPVTFNKKRDTIYFSRNQDISKNSAARNKLGIYSAILVDGQWTKVRELRINNEWYNVTTPCLSPDGKKLFFASDMPGGFGGSDLYYSEWEGDRWQDPVNLGNVINTKGNESYPFINSEGGLYFSSDGLPGLGGKDIFFSVYSVLDSAWQKPVRLDPPINSAKDDFGIMTDPLMHEGYFSSNRDKSIDIYHFRTNSPQVLYDNIQKENQHCFMLADSGSIVIDTLDLKYVWNFGDGEKATGLKVKHCFPEAGKYAIRLDIIDRKTGSLFFTKLIYHLELQDNNQAFINSPDMVLKDDIVKLDGLSSSLPGSKITGYVWNFRDGGRARGEKVTHAFKKKGEFMVNMEVVLRSTSSGEIHKTGVSKKIHVFNDNRERSAFVASQSSLKSFESGNSRNTKISAQYSAEDEFRKDAVYNVELVSSKVKIGLDNPVFKNVPRKYTVIEKYIPEDSAYIYIVDQEMNLMAAFPAYSELYSLGYKNVRIKTFVLKEPSEKELYNLIKLNGAFADSYFDDNERLTSNAFIMLDQIVNLMFKYPSMRLAIAVHSDNSSPAQASLTFSQMRAQTLVSYLINRGISSRRLVATGFGSTKPIASNNQERDMKLNRRIDFIILN
jgi:outer membrane protein OmpA-like peptidoglycan-associated protein